MTSKIDQNLELRHRMETRGQKMVTDTRKMKPEARKWKPEGAKRTLEARKWSLEARNWSLEAGIWSRNPHGGAGTGAPLPFCPDTRWGQWAQYIRSGPEGARGVLDGRSWSSEVTLF